MLLLAPFSYQMTQCDDTGRCQCCDSDAINFTERALFDDFYSVPLLDYAHPQLTSGTLPNNRAASSKMLGVELGIPGPKLTKKLH